MCANAKKAANLAQAFAFHSHSYNQGIPLWLVQ